MKLAQKKRGLRSVAGARGAGLFAWRPTPRLVTGIVAAALGLLLVFGRDLRRFFAGYFQPRITFADRQARQRAGDVKTKIVAPAAVFEGEVARTEVRLREAGALAIAASLAGVAAFAEGRPACDVNGLLRGMTERGLLPPGMTLAADNKTLETPTATLHLRFRPQPFAVEVLSLGRERRDGPALLLRVPDEGNLNTGANPNAATRYFSSLTLSDVNIPAPFAAPNAILALGWRSDTFRPTLPDGANANELAEWAQERKK